MCPAAANENINETVYFFGAAFHAKSRKSQFICEVHNSTFFQSFGGLTVSARRNASSGLKLNFSGSFAQPPVAPVLGVAPTAVAPGIFGRATALVARIKVAPGYTDAIGQALQIIGADQTVDVTTMKPILDVQLDAGQVDINWTKQGMDGIEIQVDRGTGFVFLAIDTIPNYTDTQPMPAAGQSALWKYKAIYIQADQRVGHWSDVVSIPVAG